MFDLVLRGGRVIDPASGLDALRDVAFSEGRIAAIETAIPPERARRSVDCSGAVVTPGLIDLHAHVYWGGTSLGIDPEQLAARNGSPTIVDAGSAGAGNFLGFRAHVIEPVAARGGPRILAFLNISFGGIFGFSERMMVGEGENHRLCCAREAAACIEDNRDLIVGMKVRSGRNAGGDSGIGPFEAALEAADGVGLPLMTHVDEPPPGRAAVLGLMRGGDILTHCFRPFPNAPIDGRGRLRDDVRAARDRGVLFDIGHGMGSFSFRTTRAMLEAGFLPDVISSDLHLFCLDGPAYDLPTCMSKLMAVGMPLTEAVRATTVKPADAIGRADLGRLAVGLPGDATVLRVETGSHPYADVTGEVVTGPERLVSAGVVMGGAWQANDVPVPDLSAPPPPPLRNHAEAVRRHFPGRGDGSG